MFQPTPSLVFLSYRLRRHDQPRFLVRIGDRRSGFSRLYSLAGYSGLVHADRPATSEFQFSGLGGEAAR